MRASDRVGTYCVAIVFAIFAAMFLFSLYIALFPIKAHAHPIDGKKNAAGEWCCGEGDCFVIPKQHVTARGGYDVLVPAWQSQPQIIEFPNVLFEERVPYTEAMPSPDGQFWRCMKSDGSRRCFFAPPSLF